MNLTKMLLCSLLALTLYPGQGYASGGLCEQALQSKLQTQDSKLKRLDDTLKGRLDRLENNLRSITTIEQLRDFLSEGQVARPDGRREFFEIEVYGQILRHYREGYGVRNHFRDLIDSTFKDIEDKIGVYTGLLELVEASSAYGLESSFIDYVKRKSEESLQDLFSYMTAKGWIGPQANRIAKIKDEIKNFEWPKKAGKDHQMFYRSLREMFSAYKEKLNGELKEVLTADLWNYDEHMEQGLHEVRRILRWVMLAMISRSEAFRYSKPLDPKNLEEMDDVLEMIKQTLKKNIERKSPMLQVDTGEAPGHQTVSPEATFYISALVDQVGGLKRKSELYFKLTEALEDYIGSGGRIQGLGVRPTREAIQTYLIASSARAQNPALQLNGYFEAGVSDPFSRIRAETLKLMKPFWRINPLLEFINGADDARAYWKEEKPNEDRP